MGSLRIAVLSLLGTLLVFVVGGVASEGRRAPVASGVANGAVDDYPDEWRTDLDDARSRATFDLLLPDHAQASEETLTEVYLWPEGHAVALRFPGPRSITGEHVRQTYVEVFETPWTGGNPAIAWAEDVANAGIEGESAFDIEGVPALGVEARAPNDIDRANPAFLRFVYQGLDIQISGGDDLDALVLIGESMIRQSMIR